MPRTILIHLSITLDDDDARSAYDVSHEVYESLSDAPSDGWRDEGGFDMSVTLAEEAGT